MNDPLPDPELDTLFALARARRPDTSAADYAFETRLMARLRETRTTGSVWAMVSWRMIPFFAACVVALTVWYSQVTSQVDEAEQSAYVQNADGMDSWNNFNL